jgi:selenocysteine lyase/cysteine desulfurase
VPKAIELHASYDLEQARDLADETERALAPYGLRPLRGTRAPLMRALTLQTAEPLELAHRLYEGHRVEVPVYEWEDTTLLRVSIGPYNDEADVGRLVEAVRDTLSRP